MPSGTYKRTEYHRKKLKEGQASRTSFTIQKGHIPWNKGMKGLQSYHNITGFKPGWNKGISNTWKPWLGKKRPEMTGENNSRWIKDRTKLKKQDRRNDYAYKDWRRQVWVRDGFKCKISNQDCLGRLEAHHILGWTAYPELRYDINNGITLCHTHHPRKRMEEKRLAPIFEELLKVS